MAARRRNRPARKRNKPTRQRYVSSLDGLRALCALAVIGYHMRLPWCGGGLLGVTVLFVLSGYLVTAGLMREFRTSHGTIHLGKFWLRRVTRLMPTVVTFIAVTGAVCAVFSHELFTKMRPDILPALFMVINWTKIFANESYFAAAGNPSPLTHFWSLAIEAQYYLVFPPIMYLVLRKRIPRKAVRIGLLVLALVSALLMALLYVPGADPSRPYYGTDTRAMSLLLGCWLAVIWPFDRMSTRKASRLKGARRYVPSVIGPLCIVALIAMMVFTEGYTSFSYYGGILLCSIITCGAIAGLVPDGSIIARVFSFKPLEWVGKRSYAIYLWHYPILELMNPLNATNGIPWWKLLLELVIILVISDLSYRFVEVPFRSLGKKNVDDRKAGEDREPQRESRRGTQRGGRSDRQPAERRGIPAYLPGVAVTVVAAVMLAVGLVVVKPVTAAGDNPEEKRVMQASLKKPLQDGVYDVVLIGDSVSLGANEQLNEKFPHGLMDTKGSRQAPEALSALQEYVNKGVVGDDVVWSIGTNGVLDEELMGSLLDTVGKDRTLWLVNIRTPNAKDVDNNALIDEYVKKYDNVKLIDWLGASKGHDDWFGDDGIHLTWAGRDAYANLVVETMGYEIPDKSNTTYNIMVLGDTVCIDAADLLANIYPKGLIDTADGRKPADVAKAIQGYVGQGVVGNTVMVAIGNEELLKDGDIQAIVDAVGSDRDLWLVNVRIPGPWETPNNELIENAAKSHDNVRVVDWFQASQGKDAWFEEDGFHLTSEGAKAYSDVIGKGVEIREVKSEKNNSDETSNKSEKDSDNEESASEESTSSAKSNSSSSSSAKSSTSNSSTEDTDSNSGESGSNTTGSSKSSTGESGSNESSSNKTGNSKSSTGASSSSSTRS